jgi:N-acyl-D-aspartate/D-glutamate deacylase
VICDAGMPTYLLTHWVRDRRRGERIPLEAAVKRQTRDTAELYGMADRGVLAPGMIPRDASRGAITFPTFSDPGSGGLRDVS